MADDDRYARITLRIPKDLHTKLTAASDARSHSMNAEIIARVADSFDGPDYRLSPKLVGWITAEAKANQRDFNEELDWMLSYLRDHLARREAEEEARTELLIRDGDKLYQDATRQALNDAELLDHQIQMEVMMNMHLEDQLAEEPGDNTLKHEFELSERKLKHLRDLRETIQKKVNRAKGWR